jgi:hypothetical protein
LDAVGRAVVNPLVVQAVQKPRRRRRRALLRLRPPLPDHFTAITDRRELGFHNCAEVSAVVEGRVAG